MLVISLIEVEGFRAAHAQSLVPKIAGLVKQLQDILSPPLVLKLSNTNRSVSQLETDLLLI